MSLYRRLLAGWMGVVARFGFVQTLVLLGFFYVVLVGPVSVGMRMFGRDLLDKRMRNDDATAWRDADSARPDLERAQRMT